MTQFDEKTIRETANRMLTEMGKTPIDWQIENI